MKEKKEEPTFSRNIQCSTSAEGTIIALSFGVFLPSVKESVRTDEKIANSDSGHQLQKWKHVREISVRHVHGRLFQDRWGLGQ